VNAAPRVGIAGFAAALALAGCAKVIDEGEAEDAIKSDLQRVAPGRVAVTSVDCPGGVDVDPGKTFECTFDTKDGRQGSVTMKIVNDDAQVRPVDFTAPR
jgi:hypothetical protein